MTLQKIKSRPYTAQHLGRVNGQPAFPRDTEGPLELIRQLCQELLAEAVNYCHWKSNEALDRSANGLNDLDLLIGRKDADRFSQILHRLGFKPAYVQADKQLPGVLDYYGFDRRSGRLVHAHVHYQLVLGDDTTKNYRLPLEDPYLTSASQGELFRVPAPEYEYIVFVIRMMLKHALPDAIISLQGELSASEKRELVYLAERIERSKVECILHEHLPFLKPELFAACRRALAPEADIQFRSATGQELQRTLSANARRPQAADLALKAWRRVKWGFRRHLLHIPSRKRVTTGGLMIALVGGDGAGKSTAVDELHQWLGATFPTLKVHMGKPPRSVGTSMLKAAIKVSKWLKPPSAQARLQTPGRASVPARFPGYPWLLWHVLTARDRYRAYVKARRFAAGGGIVVCDRYPLAQVQLMDGPRTDWVPATKPASRLVRRLVAIERRCYERILPPDVLIILRVEPDLAVARRHDEEAVWVRARNEEIWHADFAGVPAHVVDAGQAQTAVLAELKSIVWANL